ncbi:MAG TPA: hypothetical protein DCQ06_04290 [Myxococcales bacterium]|nr:hypothetical protein [Myxococcales bacterium]HAN30795.1 hypothetical protein [Myxococcales bacterium]
MLKLVNFFERAASISLITTVALACFESTAALFDLFGQRWTPIEVAMIVACATALPLCWRHRRAHWRDLRDVGLFCICVLISTVINDLGWSASLRLILYGGLCIASAVVHRVLPSLRNSLLSAAACAATCSALIGLCELSWPQWQSLESVLSMFRDKATMVDGARRLTGTFAHANLAGLSFAMVLPVVVTRERKFWVMITLVVSTALMATGSRGAWFAAAIGLTICHRSRWSPTIDRLNWAAIAAAVVIALSLWPMTRQRLGWHISKPQYAAELHGSKVGDGLVVRLTNSGWLKWRHAGTDPVVVELIALDAKGNNSSTNQVTLLRSVPSDETLQMVVSATDLPAGARYVSMQMMQRGLRNFGPRVVVSTSESGTAPAAAPKAAPTQSTPKAASRARLWPLALQLWWENPLWGLGADQFRKHWSQRAPDLHPDDRMHANQLILEMAVDLGLMGVLALMWLIYGGFKGGRDGVVLSILCVWLAFGLLDCPVYFHQGSVALWIWLGLLRGRCPRKQTRTQVNVTGT